MIESTKNVQIMTDLKGFNNFTEKINFDKTSEAIKQVQYSPADCILQITFEGNEVYNYDNISNEDYKSLVSDPNGHIGKLFHELIRGKASEATKKAYTDINFSLVSK